MKRIIKVLMAFSLAVVLLFVDCTQVNAQDYYDKKYNHWNSKTPYKKVNKQIAEVYVGFDEKNRTTSIMDFNGDGKKEKVVLSASGLSQYSHETKIKISINGRVGVNKNVLGNFECIYFRTIKLQRKIFAILECEDGYGGVAESKALIYLWKDNHKLKLLKTYKEKGHLDVFVARDKALKKDVLYMGGINL